MAMSETAAVQKVLSRLRNQCSRREYCVSDVREKAMKALGIAPSEFNRYISLL